METKKCCKCKEIKILTDFNKNKVKKDGYNGICRECSNLRSKKYYSDNKEHHKKVIRERAKKQILENRKKLFEYYKLNPCVDCGESDPVVLDSDHMYDKKNNISTMVHSGNSWETINNELEKCETRCSNCHRRKTAKDFGWYKDLM